MPRVAEQNGTPFAWDKAAERAAPLVAANELTDAEIAALVGVGRTTLWRWRQSPEFASRVTELSGRLRAVAERYAIGRRERRVRALDERWRALQKVIAARAADEALLAVPGGATGMLALGAKGVGVDAALLKEIREHEKQAAQELGQWTEKREMTGADGAEVVIRVLSGEASSEDV